MTSTYRIHIIDNGTNGANLDDDWNEFGIFENPLVVSKTNRKAQTNWKVQTHDLKVLECVVPYRWHSIGLLGPKTIPLETGGIEISEHEYTIYC